MLRLFSNLKMLKTLVITDVCTQSAIAKLFDSLATDQFRWSCGNLMGDKQYRLCRGRSTTENLAAYDMALLEALENGLQDDAASDFSKAFDSQL